LITPLSDPAAAHEGFRRLLAAFTRSFEMPTLWKRVPDPEPIPTPDKLARKIRYVGLNPCRPFHFGSDVHVLARDPLAYEWSAHRDAVGAIIDPWVEAATIAHALRIETHDPVAWLHAYVSSDPHVAVTGSPLPTPATVLDLASAEAAALAAHRATAAALTHRGLVRTTLLGLARSAGIDPAAVAARLQITARAVRLAPDPPRAALLCAGDDRLLVRTSWEPPAESRAVGIEALRISSHGAPRGLHRPGRISVHKEK
jgi:hypothetical protein